MTKPCFCALGRLGDVLNALPLAKLHFDRTGIKPYFQTAAAYASILDGVSYVDPVIYQGEFTSGILALYQARQLTTDIRLCQIYGFGLNPGETCTSFARQSWVSAGADVPWGSLPLVLDRRDARREASLLNAIAHRPGTKKLVLVALNGQSSPFPYAGLIRELFLSALPESEYDVLYLSGLHVERFYDFLALFDIAHCLVTVDTGHLHLAHASNVPVVSFVTRDPSPWHGSPWRPNHIGRWYYDEIPSMLNRILSEVVWADNPFNPKIIHTWSDWREWKEGEPALKRAHVAQSSWAHEYANGYWLPAEHKRTTNSRSGLDIGDPHSVSFVHDTIENGMKHATKDSDVIVLSNSDIGFTPGMTGHILEQVGRFGAAFSHRKDFDEIPKPFISEAQVSVGRWYPGTDLFAFTVGWWKQHKHEYGDFLFGREFWDEALRQLVKYHQGGNLVNCVWHCWHESFWSDDQRDTLPGNVHNLKLIREWFKETGFTHEDFRYFRCSEASHLHPPPQPPKEKK